MPVREWNLNGQLPPDWILTSLFGVNKSEALWRDWWSTRELRKRGRSSSKPGTNLIGRGFANDFKIEENSVSGSHCEIVVSSGAVTIKDLGSTNGTFINGAPVNEAALEAGQSLRLGNVEMLFHSGQEQSVAAEARPTQLTPRPAVRISSPPPVPPPVMPAAPTGAMFCKYHPKSPARYQCHKCNRSFCELCVTSRMVGGVGKRFCRSCGVECVPLQGHAVVPFKRASLQNYLERLFIRSRDLEPLCCSSQLSSSVACATCQPLGFFGGHGDGLVQGAVYGFLFLFLQNIIHTTTSDEAEPLSFPAVDELGSALFELVGTIAVSFAPVFGLDIARLFGVEIPGAAFVAAMIFGCVYFPMAFLAVAMKDTVLAANPLIVFPAIMKIPARYLIVSVILISVYEIRQLGDLLFGLNGRTALATSEASALATTLGLYAIWSFVSVYLLAVNMRILGLLYNSSKEKLGWFSH